MTQGERLAILETAVANSCRDIDTLHDAQRAIIVKQDTVIDRVTRIDEHLNNGIGQRIGQIVAEYMAEQNKRRETRAVIAGVIFAGLQVLVAAAVLFGGS